VWRRGFLDIRNGQRARFEKRKKSTRKNGWVWSFSPSEPVKKWELLEGNQREGKQSFRRDTWSAIWKKGKKSTGTHQIVRAPIHLGKKKGEGFVFK